MPVHDNDKAKLMVTASTTKIRILVYAFTQNGNENITRFFKDTLPEEANLAAGPAGSGYTLTPYARVYSAQKPDCSISTNHNLSKLRNRLEFMVLPNEEMIDNAIGAILKDLGLPMEPTGMELPVFNLRTLNPRNYVTIIPDIDLTVEQAIKCLSNFIEFTNDLRARTGLPLDELRDTFSTVSLPTEEAVSHGVGFFGRQAVASAEPRTGAFDPQTVPNAPRTQLTITAPPTGVVVSHSADFFGRRTLRPADPRTGAFDPPTAPNAPRTQLGQ